MEWEARANEANQLAMSAQTLHTETVDCLEIANSSKPDAEEQLFMLQSDKSPFHLQFPRIPSAIGHVNRQVRHQRSDFWAVGRFTSTPVTVVVSKLTSCRMRDSA